MDLPIFLKWFAGVLACGSFFVWAMVAIRMWHKLPILDPVSDKSPEVHWLPLAITFSWVGVNLVAAYTTEASDAVPTMKSLLESVQIQLILLLGCGLPLFFQRAAPRQELGFYLNDPGGQISDGALGFFASILPVAAVWFATLNFRTEENQHRLLRLLSEDASLQVLLIVVLLAVLLAPLVEELMYRVILQTSLEKVAHKREAMIATALIFSAMHGIPDAIPLFPLALVLGYVYQQRRSYLSVVIIHMLFNGTNLLFLIISRQST